MAKKSFKDWLEGLQQESWQLEMIVSGLSIALLFNGFQYLRELSNGALIWSMASPTALILSILVLFFPLAIIFLILNLCIHLLFRSLWIGTIGLRSVSGDIEFEKLGYNNQFTSYLKNKIGDFDAYIQKLEDFCSLIFSFTFLIVFCIISGMLFFSAIMVSSFIFDFLTKFILAPETADIVSFIFTLPLFLAGIMYFIDFVSLGFFKKRKRFFNWYMPIYRFISFITLSSVYRPIYHNLIDNKLGRRLGWWLIPYILIVLFLLSIRVHSHVWFPLKDAEHITYSKSDYADTRDLKRHSKLPMISSQYIDSDYLEMFIPYVPMNEDSSISRICKDFIPNKQVGVGSRILFKLTRNEAERNLNISNKSIADNSFVCLQKVNRIYLDDSLRTDIDYMLKSREENQYFGLLGVLNIADISPGKHSIRFEKLIFDVPRHQVTPQHEPSWQEQKTITFWKEQ